MTASIQPLWNRNTIQEGLPEPLIALPIKEGYELVRADSILYCKAEGNYTQIVFTNGHKLLISRKLKRVSSSISNAWFMRVHQSYLINMKYARQYVRRAGGQLVMQDGSVLPVSKNQKEELLGLFNYV